MERIALFGAGTVAGSLMGAVVMALWLSATQETERSEESIRSTTAIADCHRVAEDAVAAELACKVRNGEMRMLGGPSIQQPADPTAYRRSLRQEAQQVSQEPYIVTPGKPVLTPSPYEKLENP